MNCVVKELITICTDPYEAAREAHAIIVATEWDEFVVSVLLHFFLAINFPATNAVDSSQYVTVCLYVCS